MAKCSVAPCFSTGSHVGSSRKSRFTGLPVHLGLRYGAVAQALTSRTSVNGRLRRTASAPRAPDVNVGASTAARRTTVNGRP